MAARALWTGAINFGLVTIPVKLMTAVREKSVHFNLLHEKDMGRVHFERVCDHCGKKLAWQDVVKGYPYEKDNYVVVSDADLKKAYPEATQSVDIVSFAKLDEIDPIYFDTPYYLEPDKRGRRAYALLRDALSESGRVGIARVVIRTKEHLAALKPQGDALVLELMHWADEVSSPDDLELPKGNGKSGAPSAAEMKAARMLIDSMTSKFEPTEFRDHTREQLMELIEARAEGKAPTPVKAGKKGTTNVLDLAEMLEKSLSIRPSNDDGHPKHGRKRSATSGKSAPKPRRKAASGSEPRKRAGRTGTAARPRKSA